MKKINTATAPDFIKDVLRLEAFKELDLDAIAKERAAAYMAEHQDEIEAAKTKLRQAINVENATFFGGIKKF